MLDDDDFNIFMILFSPKTGFGAIFFIIFMIVIYFVVQDNHRECEVKSCPEGQRATLMHHECLCVTPASASKVQ